jgi:hypothetical protein
MYCLTISLSGCYLDFNEGDFGQKSCNNNAGNQVAGIVLLIAFFLMSIEYTHHSDTLSQGSGCAQPME